MSPGSRHAIPFQGGAIQFDAQARFVRHHKNAAFQADRFGDQVVLPQQMADDVAAYFKGDASFERVDWKKFTRATKPLTLIL